MSGYIHMKHGDDSKYKEIMKLLNDSFSFKGENKIFENLIPKLYNPENKPASNNVILDVDGEMRASVGLYYNSLTICGEVLKTAGIGNVAVLPEYRNNGYMGFCMAYCLDEMKQNMTDMSFLCGKRQRYEHYSYEPAGIRYRFSYGKMNIRHKLGAGKKSSLKIGRISSNDTDALAKINEIYNSRNFKAERNAEAMYDILVTWHGVPYSVYDNETLAGWIVFNSDLNDILEFGYSDEKYIEELLISAVEISEKDFISISVPPFDTPLCRYLGIFGERTSIDHPDHYTIFCYERVIRAFLKLKATYEKLCDGECVLLIEGTKLPEQIKISVKNNTVSVEETEEKPDIILKHLEAMNLVGGLYSERRNELKPECASWFPLPFYTYSQDNV